MQRVAGAAVVIATAVLLLRQMQRGTPAQRHVLAPLAAYGSSRCCCSRSSPRSRPPGSAGAGCGCRPPKVAGLEQRLAPELETAAYFVVSEAIVNAVKHSGSGVARVSLNRTNGTLRIEVTDEGGGGARAGAGVRGMADRVAAVAGDLTVDSPGRRRHARAGGDPVRVVIGEDQALMREGLRLVLERAGFEIAALTADARAAAARRGLRLDLVVADIRMPPNNTDDGLRAALELRGEAPELPVIVLSQHVSRQYATELLESGSRGVAYVLKQRIADIDAFVERCTA